MTDRNDLLDHAVDLFPVPEGSVAEVHRDVARRQRNRRIRAGAVGVIVALATAMILVRSTAPTTIPADEQQPTVTGEATGTWTGPCMDSQDGPPQQVCLGPLDEGTYTSQRFEPALTFTVPAGWNNVWDEHGEFDLWAPGWSDNGADQGTDCRIGPSPCGYLIDQPGLSVRRDPRPAQGCSGYAEATIGTSALEVATWVANHPAIATEGPSSVEVAGLTGYQLDVSLADTWRESCPGAAVWLFPGLYLRDPNMYPEFATMRLILLDLPDGGSVLIAIDEDRLDVAMPVVRSFSFDLGGGPG